MASEPYVSSRRFGEATVTLISEGTFPWQLAIEAPEDEWRQAMPDADADGAVMLGVTAVHMRLGNASVLIDPGIGEGSELAFSGLQRTPGLLPGLASIGIQPESITHVLITHAHDDHYMGLTTERDGERVAIFPRARHLIGRRDWEGNPERSDSASPLVPHLGTIERLGLLDMVDGDHEVVPGIRIIAAPGETLGHSVICLRSGGASFYDLGDLFHHACEVAHFDWTSPRRDKTAMRASRERILVEAVSDNATLFFSHERFPGWGRAVVTGDGYRWERG